eukprot:XP_016661299.1 PREDICTED: uncharacterized protein LOC107884180 [Acyrthosiphon pisum]
MFDLIKIKPGTFRANLLNEDDIKEYIKSYSLKTNTSWCVDGLPAVISIQNDHNHTVVSGEALSYLRPTRDVNIQFEEYFNSGLGISESIKIHEEKIELKHGINSTELANAHINPKYRTVRYWYDEWKKLNLGPHSGIGVNKKNETEIEIGARIQSGNKCLYGLAKLLGSRSLSKDLKIQLYITLIQPVITYVAETWPLRKSDERKLLVLERKILRKIFGPVKDMLSGEWRIRKNDELETLFHKPSILETIRNKRLAWAGHTWRSQNPLIRIVLEENPTGKRPCLRWEDVVRNDVKELGGGLDWRIQAANRENWRQESVCREGPSGRIYRRRRIPL